MPQFNPQLPDNPEDSYTRRSEGHRPVPEQAGPPVRQLTGSDKVAKAQASLYSQKADNVHPDYGAIITGVVNTAEYLVENKITEDFRKTKEGVDNEFGVGAAATVQSDITNPPPPQGLIDASKEVEGITAARQAGRLPDSHYWARLESAVRQMKARYPGHKNEVDRIVASIAGSTPANALRRALMEEADSAASSAGNDPYTKQVQGMSAAGIEMPGGAFNEDGTARYTVAQAIHVEAQEMKSRKKYEAETAQIAINKARGENTRDASLKVGKTQARHILNASVNNAIAEQGGNNAFMRVLEEEASKYSSGGTPDSASVNRAAAGIKAWESQVIRNIQQSWLDPLPGSQPGEATVALADDLTAADKEDILADTRTYFKNLLDDVTDGQYNLVKASFNLAEGMKNDEVARIYTQYKSILQGSAIREALGPEVLNTIYGKAPAFLDAQVQSVNNMATDLIMAGKKTQKDAWTDLAQVNDNPEGALAGYQQNLSIFTTPGAESAHSNTAKMMFGPESRELLAMLPESMRLRAYRSATSPEMKKSMLELRERDPASFRIYKDWVEHSMTALFDLEAKNTREAELYSDKVSITWDPKTHKLTPHWNAGGGSLSQAQQLFERMRYPKIVDSVTRLNQEIEGIAELYAVDGQDPSNTLLQVLNDMGVKQNLDPVSGPGHANRGPILSQMWGAIKDSIAADTEEVGEKVKSLATSEGGKAIAKAVTSTEDFFSGLELPDIDLPEMDMLKKQFEATVANIKAKAEASRAKRLKDEARRSQAVGANPLD
jgi:hypothetical protein